MKKVTISFLYETVKDKDEEYYQNLAFDEIYNNDDTLQYENFKVEEIGE